MPFNYQMHVFMIWNHFMLIIHIGKWIIWLSLPFKASSAVPNHSVANQPSTEPTETAGSHSCSHADVQIGFFISPGTHSPSSGSHWAAGRGGNCPSCPVAEPQALHPCRPSRGTGRSRHAPPSGLTTTQRPADGERERQSAKGDTWWREINRVRLKERRTIGQRCVSVP